jgi:hypothetical protein
VAAACIHGAALVVATTDELAGLRQLLGAETCPGVKRGGYLNLIRRKIRCSCPGDTVPAYVEVDVSAMELNQRVLLSDIRFPEGVEVSVTARPLAAARAQAARPCAAPGGRLLRCASQRDGGLPGGRPRAGRAAMRRAGRLTVALSTGLVGLKADGAVRGGRRR